MTVHTLDLESLLGLERRMLLPSRPPQGLLLDATGRRLVVNAGRTLVEFDLHHGTRTQEYSFDDAPFDASEERCVALCYTLDARSLGVVYGPQYVTEHWSDARVFDCATGGCVARPVVANNLELMAFDPDGELALCAARESLSVHRVRDGTELARLGVGHHGAAWDPIDRAVTLIEGEVVRALDPRSLKELRRYEIPADRASAFKLWGATKTLHLRCANDLSPQVAPLPLLVPSLDLPWGTRLWYDRYDDAEGLLWFSEHGERAVMRTGLLIRLFRADAEPVTLLDMSLDASDEWIEATVSGDGAVMAWRDDLLVHWKRIDV